MKCEWCQGNESIPPNADKLCPKHQSVYKARGYGRKGKRK